MSDAAARISALTGSDNAVRAPVVSAHRLRSRAVIHFTVLVLLLPQVAGRRGLVLSLERPLAPSSQIGRIDGRAAWLRSQTERRLHERCPPRKRGPSHPAEWRCPGLTWLSPSGFSRYPAVSYRGATWLPLGPARLAPLT